MSLVCWLPLDGNLENKGTLGDNFTINTTPTYINNGKIGKAMALGSISISAEYMKDIFKNNTFSICFWLYVNADTGNTSKRAMFFGNNSPRRYSLFQYPSCNDLHWSWANDTSNNVSGVYSNAFPSYKWTHCAVTYDSQKLTIYLNGIQAYQANITYSPVSLNYTTVLFSNCANDGRYLNDYRIYDHCLSAAEVHEISQGLVLHYKLDFLPYNFSTNTVTSFTNFTIGQYYYTIFSINMTDFLSSTGAVNGDKFTFSVDINATSNTKRLCARVQHYNSSSDRNSVMGNYIAPGQSGRSSVIFTVNTAYTRLDFLINNGDNGSVTANSTEQYKCTRIEKGEVHSGYFPTGITPYIQDSSGYGHNGSITGTLSLNNNSSRYTSSSYISSTEKVYITTPNFSFENMLQGTVNIWINRLSTDSTWRLYAYFANGYNWTGNQYDFIIIGSTGDQKITLDCCSNTYSFTPDLNKWYMYTITWNLSTHEAKMYVNGELKATKSSANIDTTYASKHNSHYFGNGNSTMGDYLLSDARIYATTLSAADIKQLYEVGAKVDNLGNWHTFEFTENSSIAKVKKTGITQANEVHDNLLFRNKAQIIKNNARILIQGDLNIITTKSGHIKTGGISSLPAATVQSLAGKTVRLVYDVCAPGARNSAEQGQTAYNYTRYGIHGGCTMDGSTSYPFAGELNYNGNSKHTIQTWTIPTGKSSYSALSFSIQNFDKPASTNNDTWFIKNVRLELIEGIAEDVTGTNLIEL